MTLEKSELTATANTDKLDSKERYALEYFLENKQPPLAPSLAERLFELYLQGKTCDEIRKLTPGIGLGAIVHARVTFDWDRKRDEHIAKLMQGARARVQQSTLEAVNFVCDFMAAIHKFHGDAIQHYLVSGSAADLEPIVKQLSLKEYLKVLEALLKLTGQDVKHIHHTHDLPQGTPEGPQQLTAEDASKLLAAIAEQTKKG